MALPPKQRLAPSIMSADLMDLRRVAGWVAEEHGYNWIHVEVMDGHFVPNLTVGPQVVAGLRKETSTYIDVHLLVSEPFNWLSPFKEAGVNGLTFHAESFCSAPYDPSKSYTGPTPDELPIIVACAWKIRALGMRAGLALRPQTPLSVVQAALASGAIDLLLVLMDEPGSSGPTLTPRAEGEPAPPHIVTKVQQAREAYPELDIEVDGQMNIFNMREMSRAGANVFVAGTKIFDAPDSTEAIRRMRSFIFFSL